MYASVHSCHLVYFATFMFSALIDLIFSVDGDGCVCLHLSSIIRCASKHLSWNYLRSGRPIIGLYFLHIPIVYLSEIVNDDLLASSLCCRFWRTLLSRNSMLCTSSLGKSFGKGWLGNLRFVKAASLTFLVREAVSVHVSLAVKERRFVCV